jgi:hypothetical protein
MKSVLGLFVMLFTVLSAITKKAFAFIAALVVVVLFIGLAQAASTNVARIKSGTTITNPVVSYDTLITSNVAGVTVNTPAVPKGIVRRIQNKGPYGVSMKRGNAVAVSTTGVHLGLNEVVVDDSYFGAIYFTSGYGDTPAVATSSACYVTVEGIKAP